MGEKGNMLDTGSMITGIGSGLGSPGDILGSSVEHGDTRSSSSHGTGVARAAARIAAQHMQEQLADAPGQHTAGEGLIPGTEKPSDSK
jgi:hypothetical protein